MYVCSRNEKKTQFPPQKLVVFSAMNMGFTHVILKTLFLFVYKNCSSASKIVILVYNNVVIVLAIKDSYLSVVPYLYSHYSKQLLAKVSKVFASSKPTIKITPHISIF